MNRSLPGLLGPCLFLCSVFVIACTKEEDLGRRGPPDAGSPLSHDEDVDAASAEEEDAGPPDPFGTTTNGESCDPAKLPPATSDCSIPGSYTVTELDCAGGECSDGYRLPPAPYRVSVTVTGLEVEIADGLLDRRSTCELTTDCDCVTVHGDLFRFAERGFVATRTSECSSNAATRYRRLEGSKDD